MLNRNDVREVGYRPSNAEYLSIEDCGNSVRVRLKEDPGPRRELIIPKATAAELFVKVARMLGGSLDETQYLLISLAEECAEVSQRACKALRFGLEEVQPGQELDNAERIDQEFTDLLTVHDELVERGVLLPQEPCESKRERIMKFMDYSREQGVLA